MHTYSDFIYSGSTGYTPNKSTNVEMAKITMADSVKNYSVQ